MKNTTDEYANEPFPAHGRVEMHLKGKMICVKACGPFNQELMAALMQLEQAFLAKAMLSVAPPFLELVQFEVSVLASHEVMHAHAELLKMLKAAGMAHQATAYVVPRNLEGAMFTTPIAKKNYAAVNWPFEVFETIEDAEQWLLTRAA